MANPNIVNVTSIYGKTFTGELTSSESNLLSNAFGSGSVYKINTIIVSNVDGTNAADATISVGSGTYYPLVKTVSVPADSTLVVTDKNTSFYLEEEWDIKGLASANGDLNVIISYEVIS